MTRNRPPDCPTILTNIARYLDGELPATRCRQIEEHCRGCSNCATVIKGLRETVGLCRAAGQKPLPAAVRRQARAQVQRLLKNPAVADRRRKA